MLCESSAEDGGRARRSGDPFCFCANGVPRHCSDACSAPSDALCQQVCPGYLICMASRTLPTSLSTNSGDSSSTYRRQALTTQQRSDYIPSSVTSPTLATSTRVISAGSSSTYRQNPLATQQWSGYPPSRLIGPTLPTRTSTTAADSQSTECLGALTTQQYSECVEGLLRKYWPLVVLSVLLLALLIFASARLFKHCTGRWPSRVCECDPLPEPIRRSTSTSTISDQECIVYVHY